MNGSLDFDAIRRDYPIPAIAGALVKLHRAGAEWTGCCPFHSDRSPSFTIFDNGRRFQCFGCGASGDVLDFVQRSQGVGLREAADLIGAGSLPVIAIRQTPVGHNKEDRRLEAVAIWRAAGPTQGTPAETYLRSRALTLPIPKSIRFARLRYGKSGPMHPVMVALVASIDNRAIGIQRTYLNAAGTGKAAVPKPKLSLGNVRGGSIRLAPCAAELIVAEGLEDGLTLQQELGRAVWVSAGTSNMVAMDLPQGVNSVVIGADADEAGENAARAAAERFAQQGRSVRIIRPIDAKDFNAELQMGART